MVLGRYDKLGQFQVVLRFDRIKTNQKVSEQRINICSLTKNVNIAARIWLNTIMQRLDFELKCPFKPGVYRLKKQEYVDSVSLAENDIKFPSWLQLLPIDEPFRFYATYKTRIGQNFEFIYTQVFPISLQDVL